MKTNKTSALGLLAVIMFFLTVSVVRAADLVLTKIGTLSTVGVDYSVVDYVGGIPLLEGTATPGAQVTVRINAITGYATAASPSGIWQFIPTSLNTGTNTVTITALPISIPFVLSFNTITPTPTATPTATIVPSSVLPETGVWENMVLVMIAGLAVVFLGKYIGERMQAWEGRKK
jgi:hypothetical protein